MGFQRYGTGEILPEPPEAEDEESKGSDTTEPDVLTDEADEAEDD